MAALNIPFEGDQLPGAAPYAPRIASVLIGGDDQGSAVDVEFDAQETLAIFNVAAGTLVLEVLCITETAWSASVTLNIGDGTDTDGWLATAKVAPTTAVSTGILKRSTLPTAEAFAGGKYYAAADTIDAVVGGATPAVGKTRVYIVYIPNYLHPVKGT